ncbi:TPA: hypothetical protein H2V12_001822 [Salmonella enterica]|uniref:Uncharacterized protein n=1 Tax=Salmonella enterica TaxID=28901 RepID=A0A743PUJ8_SALER|nr:hypothetical protein [Salmonella enterica]EDQ9668097.1 hypothetical protein [Salmonella enterica subsp. enterica serovar Bredeney]HAF2157358.1 hypothetical protein [Salmonella enterica]HAK7841024.1 hypothetical protein [Salmonella enterica]HAK8652363.1 hypothetical protein [Salmonella enterica]
MTNFAKPGEFTAYSEQAYDAAYRRYALMHNLSQVLMRLRDDIDSPIPENCFQAELTEIARADLEMRAALAQANGAAALCGKPPLRLSDLTRSRKA